ncbi:Tyrosine-protein kinase TXK [Tetrabaena socialis]|uniref:Tyrosine-protein kinase TXK n=1 Tax=Tetrabaena socialis TaxID=47790 RepID=A0A2J8ACT4_9CHLO|nr:Tyrosine-protein kinase TXK [Tetrabaena socialis]|eukprot:PNH10331.1 Tyrosine-protein kinase TXK [Tetrabaena socialis]
MNRRWCRLGRLEDTFEPQNPCASVLPSTPSDRPPHPSITHKVIGKGSFKTVYRASWHNTHVAVLAMRHGGMVTEARLLQSLSTHPNLVQFYRWTADEAGNEYMVMELLPLGSLDGVLRSIGGRLLTQTKMTIVQQLVSACIELTREGLVHGDLAARNLLVKSLEPPHVKLAGGCVAAGRRGAAAWPARLGAV